MTDSTEVTNIIAMINSAKTLPNELKGEIVHLLERKYKTNKHKQVKIYCPYYLTKIEVDEKLVELLKLVWKNNIMTGNSCQDNPLGYIWLNFIGYKDFDKFMSIVADKLNIDAFNRMLTTNPIGKTDWIYNIHFRNNTDIDSEEEGDEEPEYTYEYTSFSVRFPHSDLQYVIDKLRDNL